MPAVFVSGSFDDLRPRDIRLLEEAAGFGTVHAGLWTEGLAVAREGRPPRFPFDERLYLLQALRHVASVTAVSDVPPSGWPPTGLAHRRDSWVAEEGRDSEEIRAWCAARGVEVRVFGPAALEVVPSAPPLTVEERSGHPRVLVTGCFDWFHSGHVRFFEEASAFGDLYVGVGSDANVRRLKGQGHPLLPEAMRAYMVRSARAVKQAFVSSGLGWMDAEPEVETVQPRFYVVNEDGDRPEKREFCRKRGIEYVVLSRRPKPGLPARSSTALRSG